MDAEYTYSADIWNLGVIIGSTISLYVLWLLFDDQLWDLLERKKLFKDVDPRYDQEYR